MKMIVVRDGSAGLSFVGDTRWAEQEILDTVQRGGMILLLHARILQTFSMVVGPGAVAQDTHVFPIDSELDGTELWVKPTSFYYPSELAQKHIEALIKRCKENEMKLRAKEAGLMV